MGFMNKETNNYYLTKIIYLFIYLFTYYET